MNPTVRNVLAELAGLLAGGKASMLVEMIAWRSTRRRPTSRA